MARSITLCEKREAARRDEKKREDAQEMKGKGKVTNTLERKKVETKKTRQKKKVSAPPLPAAGFRCTGEPGNVLRTYYRIMAPGGNDIPARYGIILRVSARVSAHSCDPGTEPEASWLCFPVPEIGAALPAANCRRRAPAAKPAAACRSRPPSRPRAAASARTAASRPAGGRHPHRRPRHPAPPAILDRGLHRFRGGGSRRDQRRRRPGRHLRRTRRPGRRRERHRAPDAVAGRGQGGRLHDRSPPG